MNRILGQALCAPHPVEHSLRKQIGKKEKLADYTQAITNAKLIYTVRHCKIGGSYLAVLVPSPPKRTNFKTKGHTSMQHQKTKRPLYVLSLTRVYLPLRIILLCWRARNIGYETSSTKNRAHEGIIKFSPIMVDRARGCCQKHP